MRHVYTFRHVTMADIFATMSTNGTVCHILAMMYAAVQHLCTMLSAASP